MSLSCDRSRLPALSRASTTLAVGGLITGLATGLLPAQSAAAVPAAPAARTALAVAPAIAPSAPAVSTVATKRAGVLRTAASLKGRPYRYGATGPKAFDCSGYTRFVFAKNGIRLPRTTTQQARAARRISKAKARKGDLVLVGSSAYPYHVGIYAGNGKMWHSPRSGKTVRLVKIWTSNWTAGRVIAG